MNNLDFFIVIASASMHAGWNFFAKATKANKIATLWLGWLIAGIVLFPFACYTTDLSSFNSKWAVLLFLTGVVHALYIYLLGKSYAIGDMSLIYPISRGIGIFCTVCAFIILGTEVVSDRGLLGIMMLVIGIMLIAFRTFRDIEKRNVLIIAAKTGLCISGYTMIDKFSVETIPPFFYITTMFLITPIILMPFIVNKLRSELTFVLKGHKLYSSGIGFVSLFTYYLILVVLSTNTASYVVALRELSIVFGSILGVVLLKEEACIRKVIGILMIMLGAYVIKTA